MEISKVSAVLATYQGLQRTKDFILDFVTRFPEVPLVVSCVGSSEEDQKELHELFDSLYDHPRPLTLVTGSINKRVSFSENWNAAINAVSTEKFVFLHNDMYIPEMFFRNLDREISTPSEFVLYTTVEPLVNEGFVRPGKIVADFGEDLEDFKEPEFNAFVQKYIQSHETDPVQWGYGFYLAGYLSSLQDVGGFDQTRFIPVFCEDDDINLRIRLKGYGIKVAKSALVYHFSAKTTKTMKNVELHSNRVFARKWGFEARFLWETGYEVPTDVPISLGTETIGFRALSPEALDVLTYTNLEPLSSYVEVPLDLIDRVLELDPSVDSQKLVTFLPSVDIEITLTGSFNFTEFATLVGTLRFIHDRLVPGESQIGSFIVTVHNVKRGTGRVDEVNYLSLQKNTKYD